MDGSDQPLAHAAGGQSHIQQLYEAMAPKLIAQGPGFEHIFSEPLIGNPNVHYVGNKPVNISTIDNAYFASKIFPYIEGKQSPVIVEIGGGYGGLTRNLKLLNPGSRFISLDLPAANFRSTYFLSKAFPEEKFLLLTDLIEDGTWLSHHSGFAVLPSWKIQFLPDQSVDLVINTRSMMEMEQPVIDYCISHIERILTTDGVFYFANRYRKYETRLYKYKFGRGWSIKHSKPLPRQPRGHELILQRSSKPAITLWINLRWNDF